MFSNNSCSACLGTYNFQFLTYSETHMVLHMVLMSQHSSPLYNVIARNVMRTNKTEIQETCFERDNNNKISIYRENDSGTYR